MKQNYLINRFDLYLANFSKKIYKFFRFSMRFLRVILKFQWCIKRETDAMSSRHFLASVIKKICVKFHETSVVS